MRLRSGGSTEIVFASAEAMREEIATFLANDVKDPRIMGIVTVTAAEVTPELRQPQGFVSGVGSELQAAATFDGILGLRAHLPGPGGPPPGPGRRPRSSR